MYRNNYDWMLIGNSEREVDTKVKKLLRYTDYAMNFLWENSYILADIEIPLEIRLSSCITQPYSFKVSLKTPIDIY